MANFIHTMLEKIGGFLFPARCLGCKKLDELFCKKCRQKARRQDFEKPGLPWLDRLHYYGAYEDKILREALRRFKYHGTYGLSHPLAQMLKDIIKPHLSASAEMLVLPIPISKKRLRERGYNQAGLLAEALSRELSLPHLSHALLKIKNTPSQTSLSGEERIRNVKDSFALAAPENVNGRTILLVDDISTTGATLSEAARVLKQAGAKKVIGLVVARG